jgi:hypothetical protein
LNDDDKNINLEKHEYLSIKDDESAVDIDEIQFINEGKI